MGPGQYQEAEHLLMEHKTYGYGDGGSANSIGYDSIMASIGGGRCLLLYLSIAGATKGLVAQFGLLMLAW